MQHASGEEDASGEAIEKGDRLRFLMLNEADERGLLSVNLSITDAVSSLERIN